MSGKTNWIEILYVIATLIVSFSSSSCSNDHTSRNKDLNYPNILLIVSEDNGPDLGCYGSKYVKTPVLDSLAKMGVRFDNAFVTYPVCSPSRATIFTGLYPHQNGQIGLATHKYRMYPGITTLPVYLKQAGYHTGCIGKIHVNPESDIPFDFRPPKGSHLLHGNFGRKNLKLYAALADSFFQRSNKPFFLMVNYPDAHAPWKRQVDGMPTNPINGKDIQSPPAFVGANSARLRSLTADYYNSIERLDQMIGELLKKLRASGKAQNTLIIYLADHGPEFSRGKLSNYVAGLRVPLIIYGPGVTKKGDVCKELFSSIDLLPTILKAAHVTIPDMLPGMPLQPLLSNKTNGRWDRQYVFAENEGAYPFVYYPQVSIIGKRFELIHNLLYKRINPVFKLYTNHVINFAESGTTIKEIRTSSKEVQGAYATWHHPPKFELYDLKNDPYGFNNLSLDPDYKSVMQRLKNTLLKWREKTKDPLLDKRILERYTAEIDYVVKTHPKRDARKDTTFTWGYPDYFLEYMKNHK